MVATDYNEQFLDKKGTDHLIDELKAYINGIVNGNIDLSNYVTKSELQAELDALHINIDLSSYATKEELTNAINSIISSYALKTEIPNKVSELENDSGYLTEHQDLSDYARTADLHSHTNKNVLDDISATDVSNWNNAKVHSSQPHAPSTAQPNFIEDIKVNGASLLINDKTVNIDLSKYANKTEIPSLDGYATTQYVDNAVANIPSGGNVDLSNYYTKAETDMLIPSLDGYVTDTELNAKGYLTEHQDLSAYALKTEIPSLSGYATTEYVDNAIANIPTGGESGLPDSIKTGTFTVAESTVETITITHGLGTTPTMFFIFPDNPEYIIGNIDYSFIGTAKDLGFTFATKANKLMANVYNIYTTTCDDTNIIITSNSTTYMIRAGVTYRWFAWR